MVPRSWKGFQDPSGVLNYERMTLQCLRIAFPSLQQNASLLQVLPTWIETLGRKIDSAEVEKAESSEYG